MKIDKFKRWYQVRNAEGHVVFQTLNENEAKLFAGFPVNLVTMALAVALSIILPSASATVSEGINVALNSVPLASVKNPTILKYICFLKFLISFSLLTNKARVGV